MGHLSRLLSALRSTSAGTSIVCGPSFWSCSVLSRLSHLYLDPALVSLSSLLCVEEYRHKYLCSLWALSLPSLYSRVPLQVRVEEHLRKHVHSLRAVILVLSYSDPASVSLSSLISVLKNTSISTSTGCGPSLVSCLRVEEYLRKYFQSLRTSDCAQWAVSLVSGPCI